jgi:hypothetical protein
MTKSGDARAAPADIAESYDRDGFVFPLDIMGAAAARGLRADYEAAEAALAGDAERLALLYAYPDRLLPSFDRMIHHPRIIAAVSRILGPDLMVWSAGMFIKEANSHHIVSWHQDLTYWGLDQVDEATVWLALSPATRASGCMQFVAGSHKRRAVPHVDSFAPNNLLTRGQEIAVEVDAGDAVHVELKPGQASLHHGHLFHASEANGTDDRRIAAAIRYIRPSMQQQSGDKTLVALVAGEDAHGHFEVAGAPRGRLAEADFERCRRDNDVKRRVLYEGVAEGAASGGRYKI